MAYHIYTTKGLTLGSRPVREADRIYSILTRDLGLIRARATGVRKESSKLRGALEPFSLVSVSLVRGKESWRVTSAELVESLPRTLELARPLALLEKLVQGEEKHPEIFDTIESAVLAKEVASEESEMQLVANLLFHLGYLREEDLTLKGAQLVTAINHGLKSSHLS